MSLECRFERVGPILYCVIDGAFSVAAAKAVYRLVLDECVARGVTVLLLDCRGVEGRPTTMERFDFAEFAAAETVAAVDAGRTTAPKVALVGTIPLIDPRRFGETVALNRGAWIKVTTELDEATQWLGVDPSTLHAFAQTA
ncbi:MAG TPA: hypothetical protein VFQ39_10000 [Longimicrobium sp.]|nr:hypothetical protein [Longimicrobium sp.]